MILCCKSQLACSILGEKGSWLTACTHECYSPDTALGRLQLKCEVSTGSDGSNCDDLDHCVMVTSECAVQ